MIWNEASTSELCDVAHTHLLKYSSKSMHLLGEPNCRTQVLNGQERLSSLPVDEMDEWHCVDFEVAFFRQGICAVFPSSGRGATVIRGLDV
ncbi:hypothetical protein BDA96_03G401400 [Sorghum bicolor]|uniref:Uncharacterized protein n=1 Tax=Sorghum bicolor TaxID=4558 RepID=A0A921RHI7_SORBI|nr:hypothetical protein BDA96_03G401400 [Sorghum bicolor]